MRSLVVSVLLLWAASAQAQIDSLPLECGTTPTFYPRGDHWSAVPPVASNPVLLRQEAVGAVGIAGDADLTAVTAAIATWNGVQCMGASPNILLSEGSTYATRDRGDVWECPDSSP